MVFGLGSIAGPLFAGLAMTAVGPRGLFVTTVVAHVLMIGFTGWRITRRPSLPVTAKGVSRPTVSARAATPETAALAAGADEALPFGSADTGPQKHPDRTE